MKTLKPSSYLTKFRRLKADAPGAGEERFLHFLEILNENEWQSLIADLILEHANAYQIFSPPRGEELIVHGSAFFERLGLPTQQLIGRTLERIIGRALLETSHELLHGALFIVAVLPSSSTVPFLLSLMNQSDIPLEFREEVADTLANHSSEVPASFWLSIDLNSYPNLAPATISALVEHSPELALQRLAGMERPALDSTYLEYPVRIALRRLFAEPEGQAQISEVYGIAQDWLIELLDTVSDFSEFAHIRVPWKSRVRSLVPVSKTEPAVDADSEYLVQALSGEAKFRYTPSPVLMSRFVPDYLSCYLEDPALKPLGERSEKEIVGFFSSTLPKLNGGDRGAVGQKLGMTAAGLTRASGLDEVGLRHFWRCLLEGIKADPPSSTHNLPLNFLEGYARSWAQHWQMSADDLSRTIYALGDLRALARDVKRSADKRGISKLIVAVSEFHEDRIFGSLLIGLLRSVEMPGVVAAHRRWGSLETEEMGEAEFGLMNDASMTSKEKGKSEAIYKFSGYHAFARPKWLAEVAEDHANGVPGIVRKTIGEILDESADGESSSSEKEPSSPDSYAWLVLKGNVWMGFPEIEKALVSSAKRINGLQSPYGRATPLSTFNNELERFLRGQENVFIGGAVHGRLLNRWWSPGRSDQVVELFGPKELQLLMGNSWPPSNRLVFKGQLAKDGRNKELKSALTALYLGISKLLNDVAHNPDQNESMNRIIHHLMSILVQQDDAQEPSRWSFVTHEKDLVHLLTEDNDFSISS